MKTKIKRHYRSAISVLLSVCMLVSCVAVGLIGTDAAKVDNYNPVGVNWANYCMIGDAMGWSERTNDYHSMGSTVTYDCSAYIGQDMYFRVYCDGNQKGVNGSPSVSINQWYALTTTDGLNNTAHRTVTKGLLTFKVTNEGSDDGQIYVTADEDPVYKLYQSDGTAIATFTHPDSSKTFTATTGTLTAGTTYQLYLGNSYTTYKCSTSGTLTTGSNVTLEKDKSNMISFTPSVTAPYIFTWEMDANRGTYSGTLSVEARTATITTAVSPSGAGTAQVNTSQSGEYGSSVTVPAEATVYLKAENTNRYEFSEWRAVSGLTFTDRTSATTSATATATATATAVFLPINYILTKQNPAHAKIKIPNQARWGETVTPTATTDVGYKISKYKYSTNDGSTWTEVTPGSGFIMPEHNVVVSAEVTPATPLTVTMTPTGNGSISARTAEGQTISSGAQVNEGTVITFTAAPANNNAFTGWSGTGSAASISGTDSIKTVTINANTSVTATFAANVIQLVTYGTSNTATDTPAATTNMNLMESTGYYRSTTKVTSGGATGDTTGTVFSVKRTIGGVTTYAKSAASGNTWWITDSMPAVTPQHWTSDNKLEKKYRDKLGASGTQHYVFYDPETNKIWLSANADGSTGVKVIAKDGSFADNAPSNPTTSAGWGDTTLKVSKNSGTSWDNGTSANSGYAQTYTLTNAEVESETTKIKVSTTVSKASYYVYGFDINGCVTKKATKNNSAYELEFSPADIETNTSNFIEITPIYMLTDPSLTDSNATPTTIRFYVRSFSGDIKARWGGELYCYAYNDSTNTNGTWPGQPMVNLGGGTYYMDLPLNTKAITLSNAAADWIHATTLGVDLNAKDTWVTRNQYQCQSYDYDDFQYIYAKPGVGDNDEDIIFDFKYKQGAWGTAGKDNFNTLTTSSNQSSFPGTLTPGDYSGWEDYTDFYGDKIDLWGTKLTSNYNNNPVRIVVQGYYDTAAANNSYYATTYVVYKPSSTTGSNPSYSLVTYTDASGYGKKSRSEFLQRSAEQMGLTNLAGQPVQITYEYAIYHDVSTAGTKDKDNQFAERADGVWYYSETKPVKGNIIIQYADNAHSAFTDDTFAIDEDHRGTDYDGDDFTVNEGTTTHAKAYFVDNNYGRIPRALARPTNAPFDVDYDNRTVSWAYTDGYDYYDVKAEESPDGEYTFIGWYKMSAGKPEFASSEYTYQIEATANETFIARYVKTPAGQVKLAHKPVTNPSGGTGERKVWYDIVSTSNANTSLLPSGTTHEANGAITVPKTYVKYNKGYVLKVKFEVAPDDNSRKNGIYHAPTASNANLLTKNGMETHNNINVDSFALNHSGATATVDTEYVEFSVPIDQFFKRVQGTTDEYEFDSDKSLIEVFSDYDRIKTQNLTIKKTTNVENTTDTFKIKLYTSTDNNTWTAYTTALAAATDSSTLTASSGEYTIHKNEQWVMQNIPINTYVKIEESDCNTTAGYTFDGMTGVDGTVDTTNRTGVVQMTADKTVTINNIKYQFEIKYIYESYSAKTYKDNKAHNDNNRVVGANRSYTQKGEISREDLDTFFDKDAEGKLSFKNNTVRKNFINKFAPYEDDFMLNLVWDDENPSNATYEPTTKTITLETTASSVLARNVNVKFKLPYAVDTNLVPTGTTYKVPETMNRTTVYGNHVLVNDTFVTAPLTLKNNGTTMYFQYWQIKTDNQYKDTNFTDTESKRCYYNNFNMTMYQDSFVEPIYKSEEQGGLTSFDPSQMSRNDTENGEARIAFMETSRNQWNNNGGTDSDGAKKLAGDRIYTDFQLTFGYQDILLNAATTSNFKTGFVMEQVHELDKEDGKYVIKKESAYKAMYDGNTSQKAARETAVKAYIGNSANASYNDGMGTHTFKLNSNIALTTLDNKNQCKHSVDMSNKVLRGDNLEEGTLKNYVYRAYSYIKIGNNIVLSDPVYFTIYDVATINNGTTN